MGRAVIFLNGDESDYSRIKDYLKKDTLLIGCDGGAAKLFKLGCKPDVIIGDFDSLDKKILKRKDIEFIKYPEDKDYTDSELAVKYAVEKGAEEIILSGFSGSRTDHMIGNVFLLAKDVFSGADIKIIERNQEIYTISGRVVINGKKGETISFLPIFGEVKAESSSGLKYDLDKYVLSMQGNTGVSNQLTADKAKVALGNQRLLVIHHRH